MGNCTGHKLTRLLVRKLQGLASMGMDEGLPFHGHNLVHEISPAGHSLDHQPS